MSGEAAHHAYSRCAALHFEIAASLLLEEGYMVQDPGMEDYRTQFGTAPGQAFCLTCGCFLYDIADTAAGLGVKPA